MSTPFCFFITLTWNDSVSSGQSRALANELVRRGHRVVYIVDGQRTDLEDHESNPALYTWPSKRPTGRQDAAFLWRLLAAYQPDEVIAQFSAVNLVMVLSRLAGIPVRIAWYHTMSEQIDIDTTLPAWKVKLLRWRKKMVYHAASHIVANSDATLADLLSIYGISPAKTKVRLVAIADPLADRQLPGPDAGAKRIVCVGRLHSSKGQDVLLRALPSLVAAYPELCVEFIGEGPEGETYEQLARELGVDANCQFSGRLPNQIVLEHMAAATMVLVPSRQEAFGAVNLEAMAVGAPVVASSVGGIRAIIRDGEDGFLVPPDDPVALSTAMGQILADSSLRQEMGANARRRFLETFEFSAIIPVTADWCVSLVP